MNNDILTFCIPALNDAEQVRETLFHVEQSDLAFPNIYLLRHKYNTRIAFKDGALYRHFSGKGRLNGYAFPVGKITDPEQALFHVEQHAKATDTPLLFTLLTEENAKVLQSIYGDRIRFSDDPGDADYLYRRSDLIELPGTAFHKKRNQISRFEREFPNWHFEEITDENAQDAVLIAEQWAAAQEPSANHEHELRAIKNALECRRELGIRGGLLYVEKVPAALSLASYITPQVMDVHYEKCSPVYRDAYPIINREMAKLLPCELINREEDLNIPGLRQAKLSWKPCRILHKLTAIVTLC